MPQTITGEGYREFSEPRFFECTSIAEVLQIRNPVDKAHAVIAPSLGTSVEIFKFKLNDTTTSDGLNILTPANSLVSGRWFRLGSVVSVSLYGALGDDSTDNATALQAAADAAYGLVTANSPDTKHPTLYFPPGIFRSSTAVVVKEGVNVLMDGILSCTGANITALTIGRGASGVVNFSTTHSVRVKRSSQATWGTHTNSIGVQFLNPNSCDINILEARNFTIGVQLKGQGQGAVYNTIRLGLLNNNQIGVDLTNVTSTTVGWCNQNSFWGGRFTCDDGVNANVARYGVRSTSQDAPPGASSINNGNTFYSPSFELNKTAAGAEAAVPFLCVYGDQNSIIECRHESNSDTAAIFQNSAAENIVTTLFGFPATADNQGTYIDNAVFNRRRGSFNDAATLIWESGPMHKLACYYDGNSAVHIPNVHIASSGNAGIFNALSSITLASTYVEIGATRGVGVLVDTNIAKRFLVRRDVVSSANGGYMAVRAYDSGGSVLSAAGTVKATSAATLTYDGTVYGGVWIAGAASNGDYIFEVSAATKQIAVLILAPNPSIIQIRSFSIFSIEGKHAAAWPGYEECVPGSNIGTTPPTAGTWTRGRTVFNATPSASNPQGWVCVTTGTPGDWKAMANLAA